jgi:hypothetical protein
MPENLRPGLAGAMLKSVFEDLHEAGDSGTLDKVDDCHLSRTPMVVDKEGWSDVSTLLSETLDRVLEIQAESSERMAKTKERGILSKVHILHFESPDAKPSDQAEDAVEAEDTPALGE